MSTVVYLNQDLGRIGAAEVVSPVLGLSVRARNCLLRAGIRSVDRIEACEDDFLLSCPGINFDTLVEIRSQTAAYRRTTSAIHPHPAFEARAEFVHLDIPRRRCSTLGCPGPGGPSCFCGA